ncbi:DUF3592 domain-containing protein [Streptomyces sp. NPDC088747]|uniref:DUF3592 domain-containing protein n=1 Tax=Streptomyces sp. NPDC088747 TaxID=3365886 RepID=UPI003802E0A4
MNRRTGCRVILVCGPFFAATREREEGRMTDEVIGAGLLALPGLGALWFGVREVRMEGRLRRYGVRAEGVVVDQAQAPSDDHPAPVVEFTNRQGRRVRFSPPMTGASLALDLGTSVPVVYLPELPESARVCTGKHSRSRFVPLLTAGVLFLAAAVAVLIR